MPDRERVYRTEAVVLRHSDFGEADRLLTIYTPHLGKVRLLAKGVRKPRSRKAGHLELFTRSLLLVARGRNLDIITQAETIDAYTPLRHDLWRMSHACYVAELLDRFGEEQSENPSLYRLLCNALEWICQTSDLPLTTRFFELQLLSLVGYQPQLFQCLRCNAAIEPVENLFSAEAGGLICPRCGTAERGARPISLNALKVMRFLQTRGHEECQRLRLLPATHREVEELLQHYLIYILERRFKSVEFIDMVRRMAGPT